MTAICETFGRSGSRAAALACWFALLVKRPRRRLLRNPKSAVKAANKRPQSA